MVKPQNKEVASMASIAERILGNKPKEVTPKSPEPFIPNIPRKVMLDEISKIKVPDEYAKKLIEAATGKPSKLVAETPTVSLEEKLTNLIVRLQSLLKEAKQVMEEMTTTGMIGTNQKFTLGKKKNGLNKTNKRN